MAAKTFEQYIAEWDAKVNPLLDERKDRCTECLGPEPVTRDNVCRECLRYHYGYDEAEEQLVNAIIGGAVTAALKATVPSELIVVAVHRAIKEYRDKEEDAAIKGHVKVARGMD